MSRPAAPVEESASGPASPPARHRGPSRRALLIGGTAALAVGAVGAGGWAVGGDSVVRRLKGEPEPWIPTDPEGAVTLERVFSAARGREVGLFTAVPAGHGDGAGLPVCLVLHGASATTADFRAYGLARFLTAAVRSGAAPFVLAGLDGGLQRWLPAGADDPQAMLHDELPKWLAERGFGAVRAGWGWSMGGYGVLSYAVRHPGSLRAVAAFSPAVGGPGDPLLSGLEPLARTPVGIWCGTEDPLEPNVRALVAALPSPPLTADFSPGAHTRAFWNQHTVPAFTFLSRHL